MVLKKFQKTAENSVWFIVVFGELCTNDAQFLAYSRQVEDRHLMDTPECDETEDFVRRNWLVFLIVSSVLLFLFLVLMAKTCWDCCRCCFRSKKRRLSDECSSRNLLDMMGGDLAAEDFHHECGWFYEEEGSARGPFVDSEIFDLLDKGELCEDSRVTLANIPLAIILKDPLDRSTEELKIGMYLKRPEDDSCAHILADRSINSIYPVDRGSISSDPSSEAIPRASLDSLQRMVLASRRVDEPLEEAREEDAEAEEERLMQDLEAGLKAEKDAKKVHDRGDESQATTRATTRTRKTTITEVPPLVLTEQTPREEEGAWKSQQSRWLMGHGSSSSQKDSGSGSRLREMAVAFGKATSTRLQAGYDAAAQKVFGTDQKKKGGVPPSSMGKGKKQLKEKEKPKAQSQKWDFDAEEEKMLKDIFSAFDLDRTGAICYKHLAHISKKMQKGFTPEQLHLTLREADRDGDGEVNYREFLTYMGKYGLNGSGPLHMIRPEHCRVLSLEEQFQKFDEDQMGAICFKNLVQISRKHGKDYTEDEIRDAIDAADRNCDGEINFKEFKLYMEKTGLKATGPLHIFANYMEADELRRSMHGKKKKPRNTVTAIAATREFEAALKSRTKSEGKKTGQRKSSFEDNSSSKRNRAATDDVRYGEKTPKGKNHKKMFFAVEEEHAASDDDHMRKPSGGFNHLYQSEEPTPKGKRRQKDSVYRDESRDLTRSWAPGNLPKTIPPSPRGGLPSKKGSKEKTPPSGRHRQREYYDDGSDEEDGGVMLDAVIRDPLRRMERSQPARHMNNHSVMNPTIIYQAQGSGEVS